jgi:hypothetical protein
MPHLPPRHREHGTISMERLQNIDASHKGLQPLTLHRPTVALGPIVHAAIEAAVTMMRRPTRAQVAELF